MLLTLIIAPDAPLLQTTLPLQLMAVKIATSFSHKLGLLLVIIGVIGDGTLTIDTVLEACEIPHAFVQVAV
jgi:hypothetical protein